jgi:hypothetical protein
MMFYQGMEARVFGFGSGFWVDQKPKTQVGFWVFANS